jgi:hypothetical protein
LRLIALAILLLSAGTAAAQTPRIPHEVAEMAASVGIPTALDEYVESGSRPTDDSLASFLWDEGFEGTRGEDGWHRFTAVYGSDRASVRVKLTEGGSKLLVFLAQTWAPRKTTRQKGLEPWLNPVEPRPQGVFSTPPSSFTGLAFPTKGFTNAALHRAIRRLMDNADDARR